ncbi:MAG: glutamine synthetase, partial [Gammaproteobacteria bacterium]|nr:glutamine synthetase [Gammaproteobacteria bacterium]
MQPEEVRSAAQARTIVEERGLAHVKVGVFDNDGILRGKYLDRDKFLGALEKGLGFCDVVLGWDSNDQLYDNVSFTGWHTAYPDAPVRLLPETCRALPLEGNMLFFLGEFAGKAEEVCPRATLRRVLGRAASMGYAAVAAAEYEFFVFSETPASVRAKGYHGLTSLTPGYFGYSLLRSSVHSELYQALLALAADMRMPIEGLHTETGPGVIEAALHYAEALEAADRAALFKTFVKVLAQRRGLMATFMAKWSQQLPGQSGHLHVSLLRKDGSSAFHDPALPHNMTDAMRW